MIRYRSMLAVALLLPPCAFAEPEPGAADSIVPPNAQHGVYTTRNAPPEPVKPSLPSPTLLRLDEDAPAPKTPFAKSTATPPAATTGKKPAWLATAPFGKASSEVTTPVPTGPRSTQAAPVQGVDSIEASEPAPPTAIPPEADPAKENPETPTQETAPIFSASNTLKPHKLILRALNKVTGRSELIEARPGETVHFGKLDITAITCQTSDANSPLDYAGYFEMSEHVPQQLQAKPLFHGWMYATSPSITSLEHPIYDVTMVECVSDAPSRRVAKKDDKAKPAPTDASDAPVLD